MEDKDLQTIKGAIDEGIKPLKEGVEKATTDIKAIGDRVTKIEALPLNKLGMPAMIGSDDFLGYNLNHQGRFIKSKSIDRPGFDAFHKEEEVNKFCKFLIAWVRAVHPKINDPKAREALAEMNVKASLAEGAVATGGYLVPIEYQWDIVQLARSRAFFLQIARIVGMTSDVMYIPTEAALATVNWKGEAVAMAQGDPTFDRVTLTASKATAYAISSNELLQDSRIDIASILTEQFAYGIALDIDNKALNGTGIPCSGLLCSGILTTNIVYLAGSMSTITVTKLSEAIYKLSEGDLANARFMLNRLAQHYVRGMIDSTNRPIMQPLSDTMPSTILGYPWLMSEKIAVTDSGAGCIFGLFGDFQKYIIGRRIGAMALELDPYGLFDQDETRFRMISRWALSLGRETAFTKIITA